MAKSKSDENLFEDSTMTFGEHLEELRGCLWKAIVGLLVGFLVGLAVADRVVKLIESPLTEAMETHYRKETTERVGPWLEKAKPFPDKQDSQLTDEEMAQRKEYQNFVEFISEHYLAEINYIHESQLADSPETGSTTVVLGMGDPDKSDTQEEIEAAMAGSGFRRMLIWHEISEDQRIQTTSLNAHEAFSIFIKAGLIVGVVLASPWILYQIWMFVAAGLYPNEKKHVHIFLPFSLGLFLLGACMAFFFVFKPVLNFLFYFNDMLNIDPDPRISEWLSFVLILPLGFGISFQLPLVMLFLERIGIFTAQTYLAKWKVAILVIFVAAMFLTPADPTSMMLMAAPLSILYFGGVLLCYFMPRSRSPYDDLDEETT